MLTWPILMLLQNIFAAVFALQSRRLAAKYPHAHFQILAAVFAITYVAFLGYAAAYSSQVSLSAAVQAAPQLALAGVAFTVWTVLTFITFRYVDAAIGSLFATLNLIAVVAISSLTINETLSVTQLIGALILFASMLIILISHVAKKKRQGWEVALLLTIVASLAFGVAIATEKHILDDIGMPTYSVFGVGTQFLPLLLLALVYRREQFALFKNSSFVTNVVVMGAVRAAAGMLFVVSLVIADNASLIGALSGLKIILTALLAAMFLRETQFMRRKVLAGALASVGIWIMIW